MNKWQSDVLKFHKKFGVTIQAFPGYPPPSVSNLRVSLIQEETNETIKAIESGDLVELADGLVDLIYVVLGTAISYGIDLNLVWKEVQRSNMAKVGGPKREDGKILKPEGWQPPDIKKILIKQGMINENKSEPSTKDSNEK